jgi:hypothetical protein
MVAAVVAVVVAAAADSAVASIFVVSVVVSVAVILLVSVGLLLMQHTFARAWHGSLAPGTVSSRLPRFVYRTPAASFGENGQLRHS